MPDRSSLDKTRMAALKAAAQDTERRIRDAYRHGRMAGADPCTAYAGALRALRELQPGLGAYEALAAVKEALFMELELGIVDCGPDLPTKTSASAARRA